MAFSKLEQNLNADRCLVPNSSMFLYSPVLFLKLVITLTLFKEGEIAIISAPKPNTKTVNSTKNQGRVL